VKGGRCEACQGDGLVKIEMHFLPDVYVPCEVCKGKRYNRETLEVRFRGLSISDVLELTVDDAVEFFQNQPRIHQKLQTLADVGLGYIHLGQSATTLSGGEAQRVKLATELSKRDTGRTFYILDEPTTGPFEDVRVLLDVLHRRPRKHGARLEHNLGVIKTADWIIDLGPDGGNRGGEIVAAGTPEEVALIEASHTGRYVRAICRVLVEKRGNAWSVCSISSVQSWSARRAHTRRARVVSDFSLAVWSAERRSAQRSSCTDRSPEPARGMAPTKRSSPV
jgi:excinuclease ABC subunit A